MDYKTKALEAYQQKQKENEQHLAKQKQDNRLYDEEKLISRLEAALEITEGVTLIRDDQTNISYAHLDGLPDNVLFYLHHWDKYSTELHIMLVLPEIPSTEEYEEWWENPENQSIPQHALVQGWADVGDYLQKLESVGPIVIKPYSKPASKIPEFTGYFVYQGPSKTVEHILNAGAELVKVLSPEAQEFGIYLFRHD